MVPKGSELILVNGRAILKANTQAIGAASVKCVKKLCDAKDSQTLLLADLVEVSISSFYNNATANSFFFPLRLKKNVWYVIR